MKYNLLKTVQQILSSMDSDEVNDIDDTVESRQVTDIVEQTFNDIVSQIEFPEQWDLFELTPSGDTARPTLMYIPDNVVKFDWIQYDWSTDDQRNLRYVFPMNREKFFDRMNALDETDTDIYQFEYLVGSESFDVRGYKTKNPTYYTTVNDRTLIFDTFDASVGQTLQGDRTFGYGLIAPVFTRSNTFEFPLDQRQFTLLFNEAKAQCFVELKQVENAKAERRARRAWNYSQKKKGSTHASAPYYDFTPNYGKARPK